MKNGKIEKISYETISWDDWMSKYHPLDGSKEDTQWLEHIPLIILCAHSECELSINHGKREG